MQENMDIKMHDLRKKSKIKSPDLRLPKWLDKRLVFRGYSYPIKNILLIIVALVVLLSLAIFLLIARGNSQIDPNLAIERETAALTHRIGKFMELPSGEQPTLVTVTDRAKLKGQVFFENAQNGDKLLVYPKAKKAILYRPTTGKIIEVTNLTSGSSSNNQPPSNVNPEAGSQNAN
jgi:hypothetical protein